MIPAIWAWACRLFGGFALWKDDKLGKIVYQIILFAIFIFFFNKLVLDPKFKTISQQQIGHADKIEYHNENIVQAPDHRIIKLEFWIFKIAI